jgi:RNA polymerase sigma factor (sigma-70 family)
MEASALNRSLQLPRSRRLLSALSDERLAKEAQRGNGAAFEVIYDRYHRELLAFCRQMLGSREDAEDALQQTFASAFRGLPHNDQPGHLKPWLYTIARNRSLSMLRARREHPSDEIEQATFEGLAEEVERRAELKQILADLEHLPERPRAALVLAEVSDLTHAEIARVLECEAKQVKSLVFQARTALAQDRNARAIPCAEMREEIASVRGREVRRSVVGRHVRDCAGCAEFEREVRRQRALLAVALPVIPTVGLKRTVLSAAVIGGGEAGGGAGAAGGGLIVALGANGAAKVAAVAAVVGGALGGVAATEPGVFRSARMAVERGATTLGQAASGDLDRKYAEREGEENRGVAEEAARAEAAQRPKEGPSEGAAGKSTRAGEHGPRSASGGGARRSRGSGGSEGNRRSRPGSSGSRPGTRGSRPPGRGRGSRQSASRSPGSAGNGAGRAGRGSSGARRLPPLGAGGGNARPRRMLRPAPAAPRVRRSGPRRVPRALPAPRRTPKL